MFALRPPTSRAGPPERPWAECRLSRDLDGQRIRSAARQVGEIAAQSEVSTRSAAGVNGSGSAHRVGGPGTPDTCQSMPRFDRPMERGPHRALSIAEADRAPWVPGGWPSTRVQSVAAESAAWIAAVAASWIGVNTDTVRPSLAMAPLSASTSVGPPCSRS